MPNITLEDFAKTFKCSVSDFSESFIAHAQGTNWVFDLPTAEEYQDIILNILLKIENDRQVIGAPEREHIWQSGWKENLDAFLKNKSMDQIVPKFIRSNKVIRYNGNFIKPQNPYFEKDFVKLIQIYTYDRFIYDKVSQVYEFGCGSCFNLVALIDLDSERKLKFFGSDFVQSSVDLCNHIANYYKEKTGLTVLRGDLFNMKYPDRHYTIMSQSCVFTFGAVEQLASEFNHFLYYLIKQRPKIIFHIEPVMENYDKNKLFDHLQIRFHQKRGYTKGLLPSLEYLETQGIIRLLVSNRLGFGSEMFEGYHLMAWEII
jgi:SAM-dependent methyltransferase